MSYLKKYRWMWPVNLMVKIQQMGAKNQEKIVASFMDTKKMKEGKSSRNTDTNIKLGLIFRSISARLVTCTSTCPIIQYGLFGGITFEKIISDWIHVIWLFVFTMRWNIFWKMYFCAVFSSKNSCEEKENYLEAENT